MLKEASENHTSPAAGKGYKRVGRVPWGKYTKPKSREKKGGGGGGGGVGGGGGGGFVVGGGGGFFGVGGFGGAEIEEHTPSLDHTNREDLVPQRKTQLGVKGKSP